MESLIFICLLALVVFIWLDGARARELANGISKALCDKHQWQLLDQSVALKRFALRRGENGLRFRRMFSFEYSANGTERRIGYIIMLGNKLEYIEVPELEKTVTSPPLM